MFCSGGRVTEVAGSKGWRCILLLVMICEVDAGTF